MAIQKKQKAQSQDKAEKSRIFPALLAGAWAWLWEYLATRLSGVGKKLALIRANRKAAEEFVEELREEEGEK